MDGARVARWSRRVRALVSRFGVVASPEGDRVEVEGVDVTDLVRADVPVDEMLELVGERVSGSAA